jgi:hypothetical protein
MRGWFESTFGTGALAAQFVVAIIVVIVLFAIIAAFARQRNRNAGPAHARGRQPRLAVMDVAIVDDRRKLLLIRRDNVEHLVMIGGPSDLVVESAIVRNRAAPQVSAPRSADRVSDRPLESIATRLATQAHSKTQPRVQTRAPSASPAGSQAALADGPRQRSGNGAGGGSGDGPGEVRTASPLGSPQFVNPYKPPEIPQAEKKPDPAVASAEPAQTSSPAAGRAAVAGLAAGAAALTAAAAKVKRHEPSPETPPENLAKAPPVLPAEFNGSSKQATPAADSVPDAVQDAAADVTNETPPATDARISTDTDGGAEREQKSADETPVTESIETGEPAQAASAQASGKTSPDENFEESREEIRPEDPAAADTVDDNLDAALAEALVPPQGQSGDVADASPDAAGPAPSEPVDAVPDLTDAATDAAIDAAAKPTVAEPSEAAAELAPAKPFDDIFAKNADEGDLESGTSPQSDVPAPPEPEIAAAAASDAKTNTTDKTAEPAVERSAALNPFPAIPEDVRRSVLEAAKRAENSLDATSRSTAQAGTTAGTVKTTLGDLAERLEQALAEQASTLSGQVKSAAGAKPAPVTAEGRATIIEEWERGEVISSGALPPDGTPEADASADADAEAAPGAAPRQSQAMLEEETDTGVIDFNDRKKAAPKDKQSDSLEDEMARLLGELTGGKSVR